jgi:hypothetical protein
MRKSKKKFRSHRHLFLFKIPDLLRPGKTKVIKSWAKVINATSPVELKLKAEDVQRSMQMDGIGNTQTCSMAICANRQADSFKHPVEGYIDWQYSRAYVVTKLNKDGLPCECVCYGHWDDVARVNDSKGGQKQLLADLVVNGDREIHLLPPQARPPQTKHKKPVTKDKSTKRGPAKTLRLRGANLRFAVAQLGGVS